MNKFTANMRKKVDLCVHGLYVHGIVMYTQSVMRSNVVLNAHVQLHWKALVIINETAEQRLETRTCALLCIQLTSYDSNILLVVICALHAKK